MDTVGIRQLKSRLSEYVGRARRGETIRISSHGVVVAELRAPEPEPDEQVPAGLRKLEQLGFTDKIVGNDAAAYRTYEPALEKASARELLDWDRDER